MDKKKNLFKIFTQDVVYNYHIVKTEEPIGHLVYLIKNGSEINVDTLEFDPTVIVEKLISKCGVKIEKFAPSIFFTEEDNTEKLKYELEDKLTTDSNFSEFIESIKNEYRILEVKDSLLFKKDPEEYERVKQEEHNEKQKDLLEQYGKQVENQKNQREKHILSYNNDLIKLLKEYFSDIIEYEKRDFNFDNELKKIVSGLADIESWIKIDEKPFICNIKICSIEQDKLNVLLTDNTVFYTATLRFDKTVLITENIVKINEDNTLPTGMTDYNVLAQLYNVDFTTVKDWEFKNEIERFEYSIDYLAPIFKLEKDKKQQEMVKKIQEKEKEEIDEDLSPQESIEELIKKGVLKELEINSLEEHNTQFNNKNNKAKQTNPSDWYFDVFVSDNDPDEDSVIALSKDGCSLDDQLGSHSLSQNIIEALNRAGVFGECEAMEAIWGVNDFESKTKDDIIESMKNEGFTYSPGLFGE